MNDADVMARKLYGFAKQLSDLAEAVSRLGLPPPALARQIGALVATPLPPCGSRLGPLDVIEATAAVMKVPLSRVLSRDRTQHVAFVRQMAMYLCRELTASSYPAIANAIGRDHSTVIHSYNLIRRRSAVADEGALAIGFTVEAVRALLDARRSERRAEIEHSRQHAA